MENSHHPSDPRSNISKFSGYDPEKYALTDVSLTVRTNECLTPGRPPVLTQNTVGKYLLATTTELSEYGPKPTIDELPDAVIDQMVKKDKAFWVDKPGANAYTLHDAYYNYGMTTEVVKPTKQDVFPRSYQYDLDCVKYRRRHACDGLKEPGKISSLLRETQTMLCGLAKNLHTRGATQLELKAMLKIALMEKALRAQCRDCGKMHIPGLTPFQLAWAKDPGQKRWRYYPDLTSTLTSEQIRASMASVGRPFQNEACNWYNENYPPMKYDCILRKFSK